MVTYCHCADCCRISGAPVAAFAAFDEGAVHITGSLRQAKGRSDDAQRMFCAECGTPVWARYAYLPGQLYVSLGCFDDAEAFPPTRHSHASACPSWLRIADDLDRSAGTGRDALNTATGIEPKADPR